METQLFNPKGPPDHPEQRTVNDNTDGATLKRSRSFCARETALRVL